jgi:hypothetical protein
MRRVALVPRAYLTPTASLVALLALAGLEPVAAQAGSIPTMGFPNVEASRLIAPDSALYVRKTPPTDPVIRSMWEEETQRSQIPILGQYLADVIGPRLTGSPAQLKASDWAIATYKSWGLEARREEYGTWLGWTRGVTHLDLIAPRVRSLEAMMQSWSPATNGPVEGDVVTLPDADSPEAFNAWLPTVRGKFVLISAPQLSCRSPEQWQLFATPESRAEIQKSQDSVRTVWQTRTRAAANLQQRLKEAGAAGALSLSWANYPGVQRVSGNVRTQVPTIAVSCEDYATLSRLAEREQGPRVRLLAESQSAGEVPVYNTIVQIRGSTKPDEYVVLGAHFDSWDGGDGSTDNGTGSVIVMEAARLLRLAYPSPKRTIVIALWNGEEQGIIGSRAWAADHPEVIKGMHAAFNVDHGTGRLMGMGPRAHPATATVLQRYLGEMPSEITRQIYWYPPGAPATGGSDDAAFGCYKVPSYGFNSISWDYNNLTHHTDRDTYDKVIQADQRNNAALLAMLIYQAADDPNPMPRDLLDPLPMNRATGQPMLWAPCPVPTRRSGG